MENLWFIADTHFFHRNIITYCNRPFASVEEMNNIIVKNWNNLVKKNDRVFMLGDFALCGKDKIIEIGNQLHGRKILLFGNHEGANIETYRRAGFEAIYKYPILFEGHYLLSHEPILDSKYPNIHGHIHCQKIGIGYFNAGVDVNNFCPVNFEHIKSCL